MLRYATGTQIAQKSAYLLSFVNIAFLESIVLGVSYFFFRK